MKQTNEMSGASNEFKFKFRYQNDNLDKELNEKK